MHTRGKNWGNSPGVPLKGAKTCFVFTSAKEGGYVFGAVCLSVCLFVCLSVGLLANL